MQFISMLNLKLSHNPRIQFRPIRPSDLEVLEKLHGDIFPIRYESEFFQNVVNGRDIVSWGAVDRNQPNGRDDELIGFVTARIVLTKDSEIQNSGRSNETLVYILTLGVAEAYRNLGIARSLIHEVIKYASTIPTCRAVYLHVISYNNPAIHLYKKMSFQCIRRLPAFYFINNQSYDGYLFIYYLNGGRSPCSPIELIAILVTYAKSGFKKAAAKLRRNQNRKPSKWSKCNESGCLALSKQNRDVA